MLRGSCVSEGIGIGNAFVWNEDASIALCDGSSTLSFDKSTDYTSQKARFEHAVQTFLENTEELSANLKTKLVTGTDEADILFSHTLIVKDEGFQNKVNEYLTQGQSCETAVIKVADEYRQVFLQSGDEELMLRAADIEDIKQRLILILSDKSKADFSGLNEDSILVIRELLPSQVCDIVKTGIQAIITENGGFNSHAAILARAVGIPMITGVDFELVKEFEDRQIIVDAYEGLILPIESEAQFKSYMDRREVLKAEKEALEAFAASITVTRDGKRINLHANISDLTDVKEAVHVNADGVGLFRTEHIFMSEKSAPDEALQYKKYCSVAEVFGDKPVIIRTLDIGGDKQIPYLSISNKEPNPFLGHRAIRYCFENLMIFKTQLRALIKAHEKYDNIRILLPFITSVEEIKEARKIIEEIAGNNSKIKIGIMIETPAATFLTLNLAKYVDFLSIGTNDLSQYIMAADRGNDKVSGLCSHYQPAVIRAIAMTMTDANAAGCEVEICGEAAADISFIPVLIGMGIKNFSVSPAAILRVRKAISECDYKEAIDITRKVISLETEAEIKAYLQHE